MKKEFTNQVEFTVRIAVHPAFNSKEPVSLDVRAYDYVRVVVRNAKCASNAYNSRTCTTEVSKTGKDIIGLMSICEKSKDEGWKFERWLRSRRKAWSYIVKGTVGEGKKRWLNEENEDNIKELPSCSAAHHFLVRRICP